MNSPRKGNKKYAGGISIAKIWESLSILKRAEGRFPLLKPVYKEWRRWLLLQVQRQQCRTWRNLKSQRKMTPPKEDSIPVTDSPLTPPLIEIFNFPDKRIQKLFLRKLREQQQQWKKKLTGQLNEIRRTICKLRSLTEVIIIKKNQKNSGTEEYNEWNKKMR